MLIYKSGPQWPAFILHKTVHNVIVTIFYVGLLWTQTGVIMGSHLIITYMEEK